MSDGTDEGTGMLPFHCVGQSTALDALSLPITSGAGA